VFLPHLARFFLWLGGWTAVGKPPELAHSIIIGAPHTSNWDGFWAMVYKNYVGLDIKFFMKESMFWFPLGALIRAFGGIPLDRKNARNAVAGAIAAFNETERFCFGLAPEGTRSPTPGWKSGFYRIADGANVPIYFGYFDYETKVVGIGPMLTLTGDKDADMDVIQSFYSSVTAKWPEKISPIKLTR
jgi:1-acyl-sn-glycerol-3-phosphate acyltransferase